MTASDATIDPFEVHVPDEDLAELRRRITATRWPSKELVGDRSQGVQSAAIQALVTYGGTGYHWRACEAKLNALPQLTTEIDGLAIHFLLPSPGTATRWSRSSRAAIARVHGEPPAKVVLHVSNCAGCPAASVP